VLYYKTNIKHFFPYWYTVISTLVEIGKTRNCVKTLRPNSGVVFPHNFSSRFPNSTRVDITVYQHGKCFIFVKYNIFSKNKSSFLLKISFSASNIRLTPSPYSGYIEIKHGSTWRYVNEKNWDKIRQKMLCQHLGFRETDANVINTYWSRRSYKIATGDLICYNTLSSGTSCCTHLVPSTNTSYLSYAKCE
jgi:hypothetical protein